MIWYHLAAAAFVVTILLKFVVGAFSDRFDLSFEPDAFHELLFLMGFCAVSGDTPEESVLAIAVAYFALTLWSAISIYKTSLLMGLSQGRARR